MRLAKTVNCKNRIKLHKVSPMKICNNDHKGQPTSLKYRLLKERTMTNKKKNTAFMHAQVTTTHYDPKPEVQ